MHSTTPSGRLEHDIIARGYIDTLNIGGTHVDFALDPTAREKIPMVEHRREIRQAYDAWQRKRRDLWVRATPLLRHTIRRLRHHTAYTEDHFSRGRHPYHMVPVIHEFKWKWRGDRNGEANPDDRLILGEVFTDSYYSSHDRTSSAMYVAMQELLLLLGISEEESQHYLVYETGRWFLPYPASSNGYNPPFGFSRFDLYRSAESVMGLAMSKKVGAVVV